MKEGTILKKTISNKIVFLIIYIIIFYFCLANEGLQSEKERIKAIDAEIHQLMKKKEQLEILKKNILSKNKISKTPLKTEKKKPKIALVLSGGGSKGAAHVGVLKVLEKYKIPIDLVVGTSMGSMIGGMYSIGYSSGEIENILLNTDSLKFDNNSNSGNNRNVSLSNANEEFEDERYPINLNVDNGMQLSLPKGFVSSQEFYFNLKNIFSRAEKIENFDQLPIQFRAISTDLQDGKEVVIDKGDMAMGILKSMSIPTIFEPVEDNGHFYVDGGVVNNFPVDIAMKMGADIVIAVDTTADPIIIDDKSSFITVLGQLSMYYGDVNTEFQKKLPTILIVPNVKDRSSIDFSDIKGIIDEGEKATLKYEKYLTDLSDSQKFSSIKENMLKDYKFIINDVTISENVSITLKKVMDLKPVKGNFLSKDEIEKWAKEISSLIFIDKVFYNIKDDNLYFDIREKKDVYIRASLEYTTNYGGSLTLLANFPQYSVWSQNYILRGEISRYPKISVGRFSYYDLNNIKIGTSFIFGYEKNPMFIYNRSDNVSTYTSNVFSGSMDVFTTLYKKSLIGMSLSYKKGSNKYFSGNRESSYFVKNFERMTSRAYLSIDTLNNKFFPTKGLFLYVEGMNDNNRNRGYKAISNFYFPVSEKVSVNVGASAGLLKGKHLHSDNLFRIGGSNNINERDQLPFFGLPDMGRYTNEFYIVNAGVQYKLNDSLYILGKYNIMSYESNDIFYQKNRKIYDNFIDGYGLGIGWNSVAGPVSFFITTNKDNKNSPLYEVRVDFSF
ncbi:MAG: patatin-like phospholipase family protein [Fusobacteriaceae bacterium]|jgi:NTE family protein|nr:patatin-like phospholipase family protein [Fusobacteriaceae bacterium]